MFKYHLSQKYFSDLRGTNYNAQLKILILIIAQCKSINYYYYYYYYYYYQKGIIWCIYNKFLHWAKWHLCSQLSMKSPNLFFLFIIIKISFENVIKFSVLLVLFSIFLVDQIIQNLMNVQMGCMPMIQVSVNYGMTQCKPLLMLITVEV